MKLTVTGVEKIGDVTAKVTLQGKGATTYTDSLVKYVPWCDRHVYVLDGEFDIELWQHMDQQNTLGEDPAISTRPGGQMNNGLGVQRG